LAITTEFYASAENQPKNFGHVYGGAAAAEKIFFFFKSL